MNYSGIKYADMINGEGIRISLFVSGCSHKCRDCFNRDTWNPHYGEVFTKKQEDEIIDYVKKYPFVRGLSLLGGDPTYKTNIEPLVTFLKRFKAEFPTKDIWLWSGYTWEEIIKDENLKKLISLCDILIDGKFQKDLKDLSLKWRGSTNQRVINIQESLKNNKIKLYVK